MEKKETKQQSIKNSITICIIILLASILGVYYTINNLKFGLDLAGGFEVLYKVESLDGSKVTDDMITSTRKVIEKRIDVLGVSEPEISVEGNNIRVKLAGVTDADEARKTISTVASLTFRTTDGTLLMSSDVLESGQASKQMDTNGYFISLKINDIDTFYKKTKEVSKSSNPYMVIWLDYDESMKLEKSPIGNNYGYKEYDEDGNEIAFHACGNLKNSNCLSYAGVNEGLSSDTVSLTKGGGFDSDEATELVELINSGSMPTKLTEISSKTVSASFGQDSLSKTFLAGVIGISLIALLLIVLYRVSGFIASVGMIAYTFLTLLIFNLVGGRLTLQGIAALVIGIGMAVDSAVISFSRIKEELKSGSSLENAFKNGNKESFTSILDANITTLIAAIILFFLGESSVKGFATMLIISIIVTFLIMVYLTRYLIGKFATLEYFDNHRNLFIGYKNKKNSMLDKFNFVKYRKIVYVVFIVLFIFATTFIYSKGLNLGIDFKGGSTITINSKDKISNSKIEKDIKELGYKVKNIDRVDNNIVTVTVKDVLNNKETTNTEEYFKDKYDATTSVGAISNEVKKDLASNAIKALIIACIGMVIYTTIRFKFSYGISAIIVLVNNALLVLLLFSLLHLEVNSIFIAAILSIIGYAINDTIVIFDRIRENYSKLNKTKMKKENDLEEVVNKSLRQTVGRCIITTVTTLIPVLSLIILGSYEILNFNLALLFGLIIGNISSLFFSGQIWIIFEKRMIKNRNKKKWYDDGKKEPEELKIKGINC